MRGKELVLDMVNTYFMLVTMISGVMMILGMYFFPNARFGYEAFGIPFIYAAWGTLPNIIMYAKKELPVKQFLIRKLIQLVLVEVIVIAIAIPDEIIDEGRTEVVVSLAVSIFVIYILTHLIEWFQNCAVAKRMTEELLTFQQNHK